MKANVTPELDSKWWSKNKPKTLKKTGLGAALGKYEVARNTFEKCARSGSGDINKSFMEAKTILGGEVSKCVGVGIKEANSMLHAETISALQKYKSSVIPAESKRLDTLFATAKSALDSSNQKALAEYVKILEAWKLVGEGSAKMVLAARKESSTLEDLLAKAAEAARLGKPEDAKTAASRAELLQDKLTAMARGVANEVKKARKLTFALDTKSLNDAQKRQFDKDSNKRMTFEQQAEQNHATLEMDVKAAADVVAECRAAASGGANLEKLYLKTMDKLVERAFRYAQQDIDVASRECSGATANVAIAIDNYNDAKSDKDKNEAKGRATQFLKHAITQVGALKKALDSARKDVDKSLDSMPKEIVKPSNDSFAKLFAELEKAMKIYDQETANHAKEMKKITNLASKVKGLA
jgi:hypothetical protein